MKSKIIQQGAEAIIKLENNKIIKDRIAKGYRLKILDKKLRKQRTKREAKILDKLKSLLPVPKLIKQEENILEIEFIKGKKLSENLDKEKNKQEIIKQAGKQTATMHDNDIIHGDLTTSNMILQEKTNKLFFIDFGLSFVSQRIEDKAVDLHLIKQALEAKHYKFYKSLFSAFLKGYKKSKNYEKTLKQLEKVESRGRYKH